eukprot:m.379713 g.379713  ORF g.379713 m.379713 type:complete len:50 (-) comp20957_c2_seq13:2262-2411(-)
MLTPRNSDGAMHMSWRSTIYPITVVGTNVHDRRPAVHVVQDINSDLNVI